MFVPPYFGAWNYLMQWFAFAYIIVAEYASVNTACNQIFCFYKVEPANTGSLPRPLKIPREVLEAPKMSAACGGGSEIGGGRRNEPWERQ
jgi:hypothetical protein